MRNVLFLIAIFLVSSAYGQGEIRYEHHGVARTEGDLLRAKDKFQMAVRGTKASAGSFRTLHGCLMYCPIAGGGYKYAYSYGEPSPEVAKETTRLSLNSCPGDCTGAVQMVTRNNRE